MRSILGFMLFLGMYTHVAGTSTPVNVMSDIVRVPIVTADGPAYILIGTGARPQHMKSSETNFPEGLILVQEASEGLKVRFMESEAVPDDMKGSLLEKMNSMKISGRDPKTTVQPVQDSSHVSLALSTSTNEADASSSIHPMIAEPLAEDMNDESMHSLSPDLAASTEEVFPSAKTDWIPSVAPTTSVTTSLSNTSMNQSSIDPSSQKGKQSGKMSGQRDSSSSAKQAGVMYQSAVTIFAIVLVIMSVSMM